MTGTSRRPLHRKAVRRLTVSAVIAVLTIAALLSFLMPWSGTEEKPPSAAGQADAPPASRVPALVLIEEDKPAYIPDAAEVEALAKMLYGEARGVVSDTEKAACVWCVLNRVDDPRFPDTVLEVVAAPYQFAGYSADYRTAYRKISSKRSGNSAASFGLSIYGNTIITTGSTTGRITQGLQITFSTIGHRNRADTDGSRRATRRSRTRKSRQRLNAIIRKRSRRARRRDTYSWKQKARNTGISISNMY